MAWLTRFLAAIAFLAVGVIFSPESKEGGCLSSHFFYVKLVHFLCFTTTFGVLWFTFIFGVLFFVALPRHQFGNIRSKMFPACFSLGGVCCGLSIVSFGYVHPWRYSSFKEKYQLGFLISSFTFILVNLFVFTPMTIKVMKQRHKVEREANIGEDIGWTKNREVAKINPKLAAMNKKFGMVHGLSALAMIMSLGSLVMHSLYLAEKLSH